MANKHNKALYDFILKKFDAGHKQLAEISKSINALDEKINDPSIKDSIKLQWIHDRAALIRDEKAIKRGMIEDITLESRKTESAIERDNALNGNDITEDAKLFNLGINLSVDDVLGIMDRNADNATMMSLAMRYLESKNLDSYKVRNEIAERFPQYTAYEDDIAAAQKARIDCATILNAYPTVITKVEPTHEIVDGKLVNKETIVPPDLYTAYIAKGSPLESMLTGIEPSDDSNE